MEEMDTEIACIRLGNFHVIPVTSPELACEFLKIQGSIFYSRPICMSASLVSNGYLTPPFVPSGDQWMKIISDYLPWLSVFDLDGHKAIIKKAYATATKHIDIEVDHKIQIWKDGNKSLEEDILDVLIMLKDKNGNPLMNVKEIKAQILTI
ncbi:hypothetical protein KY284_019140 [Solanum tuberosum]|nr:hypothetical protein KY284_019140 [Solanum tuberosum]